MDRATFWALIDASRRGVDADDPDAQLETLAVQLAKLTPEELIGFQCVFDALLDESYRADLWAAAFLINGGCSDDGFEYFCRGLVALGQKPYEAALANPDSLARVIKESDEIDFEQIACVAGEVYERKTGVGYVEYLNLVYAARGRPDRILVGDLDDWFGPDGDVDPAKAKARFPKLYRKFGD